MRRLVRLITSQIQYKIILPYLSLVLLVTLAGAAIALALTAASAQERLNEQLKQIARSNSTALLQRERDHLAFLYLVALAQDNPGANAQSMPAAFASGDAAEIERALTPLYDYQRQFRESLDVDRLIAFDSTGKAHLDWLRNGDDQPPSKIEGTNLSSVATIQQVLNSTPGDDIDKYASLIQFLPDPQPYFYTVVPVSNDQQVVGGVLIGIKIDRMLQLFERTSQSVITNYYANDGTPIGSSLLRREDELPSYAMSERTLQQLASDNTGAVFDTVQLRAKGYQLAYSPLVIAQSQVGYFSVGLSSDFQTESLSLSRNAILAITLALALGAVLIGYAIARSITRPLSALVATAEAVSGGDLERRTSIATQDELGRLGVAFNQMTEHLLRLYNTSRDLSSKINIEDVLEVTGETARALVPGVEIVALLDERGSWHYALPRDASPELRQLAPVRLSSGDLMLHELARSRKQQLLDGGDPMLATSGLANVAGFQQLLLTPLLIQDSLEGVLIFGHRDSNVMTPAELPTLTATANMAASVLYNALLFRQVAEDASERAAILQSIGDGVLVVNSSGTITMANQAAQQMLGVPLAQLQRHSFDDLPLERAVGGQNLFGEARAGADHYTIHGKTITLNRAPVVDAAMQRSGEVFVLHDISSEVAIDQAKTDFIATISHELRTPLTPIYSYAELLLRGVCGELNADQREVIDVIHNRAEQIRGLIQNIVLVASIQSDTLATEIEPLDIGAVIETTIAPMQRAFDKKGLNLTFSIPSDLPHVLSDREQLRIILTQLLDNARRYTLQGTVTLSAVHHNNLIQIDISDTGPGIAPERISWLFTRFHRIEGNSSQERGGGLGLAITRQLVERLGGNVWVHSEVGQGSTFSFSLPVADGHTHAAAVSQLKNATA
ncbi:MAG: HAMP domain-containing protein [Roseiflexaceae bacterium]|nr:HAMP domain-containing protein [Roseiflexaceae bacterium]